MSTITAILEADVDGTLHLPVPAELRWGKVQVVATLDAVSEMPVGVVGGGTPLDALKELRKLGGLREVIPDPVEWQREQRQAQVEWMPLR